MLEVLKKEDGKIKRLRTLYKKHRAFVLTPKFSVYLQSPPNIKYCV